MDKPSTTSAKLSVRQLVVDRDGSSPTNLPMKASAAPKAATNGGVRSAFERGRARQDRCRCRVVGRRLGRSLQDLVGFLGELNAVGCDLYLEKQAVDTTTPAGRALFQMLGIFAEFERAIIQERIHAELARARVVGTKSGKPIGRARIGAKGFSRPPASAAPAPAWCSGSKLRWPEAITRRARKDSPTCP
jgi:hypothetical protein